MCSERIVLHIQVLCNRTVTTLVSLFALIMFNLDVKPVAPVYSYFAVSFSNVIATTCQYEALKFVSFPVQTLGRLETHLIGRVRKSDWCLI